MSLASQGQNLFKIALINALCFCSKDNYAHTDISESMYFEKVDSVSEYLNSEEEACGEC